MEVSHDSREIPSSHRSASPMTPAAGGRFASAIRPRTMSSITRCGRPASTAGRPVPRDWRSADNVRFHSTRADAERAGFRPCKRCRPDEPPLCRATARRRDPRLPTHRDCGSRSRLCQDWPHRVNMSPFHFHRVFKMLTGVTPKAYAAANRTQRARTELANGKSVTEAIYGAGFNSSGRFYESVAQQLGMTPTAFRNGGSENEYPLCHGEEFTRVDSRRRDGEGDLRDLPRRRSR